MITVTDNRDTGFREVRHDEVSVSWASIKNIENALGYQASRPLIDSTPPWGTYFKTLKIHEAESVYAS